MRQLFLFFLLLACTARAAETPAQANKRLFDATVDELNFRTFETVYDKSFARGKYPVTLRTAQARKAFGQFGDNKPLKQLFENYNAIAERYKNRFGNGSLTLAEFERQLSSVLLDKNFEFFIRSLPRDERVALIRAEQRLIKQTTARFNAAGETSETSPQPTTDAQAEEPLAAPLTTNDDATDGPTPAADRAASLDGPALPEAEAPRGPAAHHDWLDYFTLLFVMANTLLLGYLIVNTLPAINRRINRLAPEPEPEEAPVTARSFMAKMRPPRPADNYREDRYHDETDPEDEPQYPSEHDEEDEALPRR